MRAGIRPIYLSDRHATTGQAATTLDFAHYDSEKSYSEKWLQELIHQNPSILPVTAFEPSFENIVPVCRELQTGSGPIDNLFVTPDGDLVFVECKLWRNPEARRKVVAQIIDYIAAISEWDYDELMRAINQQNRTSMPNPLYAVLQDHPEQPDEATFTDNVTRNLKQGRHLLLIVGDGIRENAERMADFLQQRMNLHFTLGLLELNICAIPDSDAVVVIPNVIIKTALIERGVVTLAQDNLRFIQPGPEEKRPGKVRAENLTEAKFFEKMACINPKHVEWLRSFVSMLDKLGITWETKKSLIPRYSIDGRNEFNFGFFRPDGAFLTKNATWALTDLGLRHLGEKYIKDVSAIVSGSQVNDQGNVCINGRILNISDLYGKEEAITRVIADFISELQTTTSEME